MVLFAACRGRVNWENATIAIQSLDTGERRDIVQGGSHPQFTRRQDIWSMHGVRRSWRRRSISND